MSSILATSLTCGKLDDWLIGSLGNQHSTLFSPDPLNAMKQELTVSELRQEGNKLFAQQKYQEAIDCYSRAIIWNPSIAALFTNRALCYIKLSKWERAIEDSRRALEMDPNSVKGHFFLGSALLEMEFYDDAIKHLQRAHDLARDQKFNCGDEIAYQYRVAKKKRWNQWEDKRIKEEIELQTYLNELINRDKQEKIEMIRNSAKNIGDRQRALEREVDSKCHQYSTELNAMFAILDSRRKKREVPDYLCGKISFEIMKDPVITPSGITYDRKAIEEHLHRVGHFDPITRHPLTIDQLIPNLALKEVVDAFMAENDWAKEY